jgi:hypothetical protein
VKVATTSTVTNFQRIFAEILPLISFLFIGSEVSHGPASFVANPKDDYSHYLAKGDPYHRFDKNCMNGLNMRGFWPGDNC